MDFVALTCPSCGGKLQVANHVERFACAHCGTEFIVERYGGVINLEKVVQGINQVKEKVENVQTGVDKVNDELLRIRAEQHIRDLYYRKSNLEKPKSKMGNYVKALIGSIALLALANVFPDMGGFQYLMSFIAVPLIIFSVILIFTDINKTREYNKTIQMIDDQIAQIQRTL